jgi:membrane-associated phospholipid phosphatase
MSAASDVRAERGWAVLALFSGAAFLALLVMNTLHQTQGLDDLVWRVTDPGGEWGFRQLLAVRISDALQPTHMIGLFAVVSAAIGGYRRSWRPLGRFALLVAPAIMVELGLKWSLPRVNPRPYLGHTGGSFPSGHMLSAVICSGGAVLLLATRHRWWHWLLAMVAPAVVGASLMIGVLHWASDVVGGALLGTSLLACSALPSTHRMTHQDRHLPKRRISRLPPP